MTAMTQTAPLITAKNLWKKYGNNVVLERMNISVTAGEFITMVGTSGCGKSTFLKGKLFAFLLEIGLFIVCLKSCYLFFNSNTSQ